MLYFASVFLTILNFNDMKAKYFKTWAKAQTEVYSAMVSAMETAVNNLNNLKYSDNVKTGVLKWVRPL